MLARASRHDATPVGVGAFFAVLSHGSAGAQPWALGQNPFGIPGVKKQIPVRYTT